jgi:hypothetical protein
LQPGDADARRSVTRLTSAVAEKEKALSSSASSGSAFRGVFRSSNPNDDYTGSAGSTSSGSSSSKSRIEALERLSKLRASGVLTKQEFDREKERILKE